MDEIITQIHQLLTAAGLHAIRAFPVGRLPNLLSPMIAVGQSELRLRDFSDLLGVSSGQSLCGAEMDFVIQLDVYSPQRDGGDPCTQTVGCALAAVSAGLPSCTLKDIYVGPVHYDKDIDYFRSSIRLTFGTLLYHTRH